MANATITGTASNFGSISGVLAGEAGTVAGTITGVVAGSLTGSVGVPGPGVPSDGLEGQILAKASDTSFDTVWQDNYATELRIVARNETGSTLAKGTVVYINGAAGNKPTLAKALATGDATSAQTLGMVSADILNNQNGEVTVRGLLAGLDTSAFAAGTQLYLSGTTAGVVTSTKPSAPVHLVYVGIVSRQHANQGQVEVAVQNGFELHELHDVKITSVSNGQVLKYDSAQGLWVNGTDSSGVAWGGITGTLSAQTDLQTALDAKAPIASPTFTGTVTIPGGASISGYANTTGSTVTFSNGILANAGITASTLNVASGGVLSFAADSTQQNTAYPGASIFLLKGDNLSGLGNTATARTNLGLGTMATETAANYFLGSYIVSTYAPLASPALTGTPTAPTAAVDTNTTQIASTAYVIGQGYLKSSTASSTYLTQANAASTYQTQAGMSSYLTTSAAASTYQTISGMSSYLTTSAASSTYAPLASPALTGTPTAPTAAVDTNTTQVATTAYVIGQGYLKSATASSTYAPLASPALTGTPTAPTAAAATNTTQIATTAFVQQEVPAASTTAAGKVQLATFTTPSPTDTLSAISPKVMMDHIMHQGYGFWGVRGSTLTNGAGSSATSYSTRVTEIVGPNTLTAGYAMAVWDTAATSFGMVGMTRGSRADQRAWNKPVWASGRGHFGYMANANYNGDTNSVVRVSVGGKTAGGSGNISINEPGFGWYIVPGSAMVLQVSIGNGTALTNVTSSFTPVAREIFDWKLYSDGAGNVTLYVNDSQVATTSNGPTTSTPEAYNFYFEMVEQTASAATRILWMSINPKFYWGV